MADNKRYYYLKLKENFFDSEEIKILESMPNGIHYSNLLMKLYLKSLKYNGALRFNDYIPYDVSMIATITNLNIDVVRSGLSKLYEMKLIERMDDGTIYMMNIQSFIGKSSSEADRKKLFRAKIEEEKLLLSQKNEFQGGQMSADCPVEVGTFSDKRPPEIEIDKEIEKELKKEIETENIDKMKNKNASVNLVNYFDSRTGMVGGLSLASVKTAVEIHGEENVRKAMDRALDRDKPTMIYINGILKNWAKEGYPKEGEHNGTRGANKNYGASTNEFAGFKPPQPRTLTEEERKALEEELI